MKSIEYLREADRYLRCARKEWMLEQHNNQKERSAVSVNIHNLENDILNLILRIANEENRK